MYGGTRCHDSTWSDKEQSKEIKYLYVWLVGVGVSLLLSQDNAEGIKDWVVGREYPPRGEVE